MGVIRTHALESALPLMSHTLSDRVFLAELSLYGKTLELPAYQYFRRFHEAASSWDRGSAAHQIKRLFKAGTRQVRLATWKYHWGLVRRLLHSPLGYGPKLKLLLFLGRRIVWDRYVLLDEFWQLMSHQSRLGQSEARKVRP
jgi:hypothetical protein